MGIPVGATESGLKMLTFQRRLKAAPWPMLNFPNRSRIFDPTRRAVRFWGHDSAMEWSFFVTATECGAP